MVQAFLKSVAAVAGFALGGTAAAQPAMQELNFESVTPRGHFELAAGGFSRTPVTIPGKLMLPPQAASGRVPAVVIHHGSGGVGPHHYSRWAQAAAQAGYAAYVIDSFTPRKITSTVVDQDVVSHAADIADAFGALRTLAAHPAIDPERIAHVGFSRGGMTAMAATVEAFRVAIVGAGGPRFRVAVAHYPGCHYTFHMEQRSATPLRIFIGAKDDYTPPSQCETYVQYMRKRGEDVAMVAYPDNFHSYEWDFALMQQSGAQNFGRCQPLAVQLDEAPPNPRLLPEEKRLVAHGTPLPQVAAAVFQWRGRCAWRGATVGHNPSADLRETSVRDTLKVFQEFFGR